MRDRPPPLVLLVAGSPGAGKSTASRYLARTLRLALLDKDTLYQPFIHACVQAAGVEAGDEASPAYNREHPAFLTYQPLEYEGLVRVAVENAGVGVGSVLCAPFVYELRDPGWRQRAFAALDAVARVHLVWVYVADDARRRRVQQRGLSRDRNKLAHWDGESLRADPPETSPFPCSLVANDGTRDELERALGRVVRGLGGG